ncbi:MAG TPA: HD domain-containing phosphohydrolase [Thermoanaerobaculia bacterium]|nr:HD domain-containing phosphohydrolase [Thermoanaerobaculia bacterium]
MVLGSAAAGLAQLVHSIPAFRGLEPLTAFHVPAALWFGPLGLVGSVLGSYLGFALLGSVSLVVLACMVLPAVAAMVVFRLAPGVGRQLPNLRSAVALLVATGLGAVPLALLHLGGGPALTWQAWAAVVGSVALLAPPLLVTLGPGLRRYGTRIPFEVEPRPFRRWMPVQSREPAGGEAHAWRLVPRRKLAWLGPLLLALGTAAGVRALDARIGPGFGWVDLALLIPVLWVTLDYGLRGGLVAASAVAALHFWLLPAGSEGLVLADHAATLAYCTIAALAGSAREREARLRDELAEANQRLRQDLGRTVQALRSAVAAKDAYTEGHLSRVATYALELGQRLGLGRNDLEDLEIASLLHDVGKIGIPEGILMKPGPLTADEQASVQRHPEIGARILTEVEGLEQAAAMVLHHQERFDGSRDGDYPGYPAGLAGEQIPLGARIIAVVDAFDAMTSDRPYRRALSPPEATARLAGERGRQFDPQVVDAFLNLIVERPWRTGDPGDPGEQAGDDGRGAPLGWLPGGARI